MTQKKQQTVANENKIQLNQAVTQDATITDSAEASSEQKKDIVITPDVIPPATNVNIQPNHSSAPNNTSTSSTQNLAVINQQSDFSLIEIDERNKYINEKKRELFLESLKLYGGQICNKIIQITNENKRTSDGVNYVDLYNNPIVLLKKTYEGLRKDNQNLFGEIKKAYIKVNDLDQSIKQYSLPLQLILGVMLKAYKDSFPDKFIDNIRNEKSLVTSTCYNYISLASIIDHIQDNRIFSIGVTYLYKLSSLLEKKQFDNKEALKDIIDIFYKLTNADNALSGDDEKFTDAEFQLAVEYVIFYYTIGKPNELNKEHFSKLYDARYEWTREDMNFIKKRSFAKDKKGKYIKIGNSLNQLSDPKFINVYMQSLINNNFNGKLARDEIQNKSPKATTAKVKSKSGNQFTIPWATAHLTQTIDTYLSESKVIKPKELEALKDLQTKLNEFITKNTIQNKAGAK